MHFPNRDFRTRLGKTYCGVAYTLCQKNQIADQY